VGTHFILFWLPAILHAKGLPASQAILATTMYALGSIICALVTPPIVDHFGVERIIATILRMEAACVLAVGVFELPFQVLCVVICGAGIGIGGCQHGINSVSGAMYPTAIRATGTGWALGFGRIGQIGEPLVGGTLLGLG
jgi:MFS transporter, AAHS family, 4-hydroxybenzoate transporter